MKLLYITIIYISVTFASEYALINCSWPCPNITHGCIISAQEAHCGQRIDNSWIINSPQKAPYYTGAYISVHLQPCQPAPIPPLPPAALDNHTEPGQSIILWPIDNIRRPHDAYLGNCGHGYYCSSAGTDILFPVCRQRLKEKNSCESSNQCTTSFCHEQTCQLNTDGHNITDKNERWNGTHDHSKDKTAQILASVFGIVGGIVMLGIAFIAYRKHKSNKKKKETVYYSQNNSSLPLQEEQFASDFQHDMTQSQLHHLHSNYTHPPPSYKP